MELNPNEFPYVKSFKINDCYTYKGLVVDATPKDKLFKHIILTGKNGSGKTTTLDSISRVINFSLTQSSSAEEHIENLQNVIDSHPGHSAIPGWQSEIDALNKVSIEFSGTGSKYFSVKRNSFVYSFFKAHRQVQLANVSTVTKEQEFISGLSQNENQEHFVSQFKQYLVNKKVYQAFDYMDANSTGVDQNEKFFTNFTETLRNIFHDKDLKLDFYRENFEFFLMLSDGRKITFNQLSEGFSAFLSIIMDLLMRVDLIRKELKDFSFDPCGIVIIDEPETHFHIEMQYEILPLISKLFPNIQLLVATHSPAVISSLKDAIVYDLTSQIQDADWILGSSYSELMVNHFGLDNEFSPIADKILIDVDNAYKEKNVQLLNAILIENERFLTPALKLEIESRIIDLDTKE